jgi:hypothetical protein
MLLRTQKSIAIAKPAHTKIPVLEMKEYIDKHLFKIRLVSGNAVASRYAL